MARTSKLTLAFIDHHPAAAASVLESLSVEDAVAFIDTVPTPYAAKILNAANLSLGVKVFEHLPVASAAAILNETEFVTASALLRGVHQDQRRSLLEGLSGRLRQRLETAMEFAIDSVGARMSTAPVTATAGETVADALKRIREDRAGDSDAVFILDEQRRWLGTVRISLLLRHSGKKSLAELMDRGCAPVSAQTNISQVLMLDAWNLCNQLPVVSRRGELLGVLHKSATTNSAPVDELLGFAGSPSIVESLLQMLVQTAPDLSAAVLSNQARREFEERRHEQ